MRKDAPIIGCIPGNDTLFELRTALQRAEMEIDGGLSNRVYPMMQVNDVSALLGNTGFSLVTLDTEDVCVEYPGVEELLGDLRATGETNCIADRYKRSCFDSAYPLLL